ncbi:DNA-binding response regulator [Streptomyces avicenniae]|uniref:response regulator transcription factor n=1 Tax=Streptomyces avicenniae TaxID=500153 RepID=UPI001CBA6135|nr:DNA-binding response regulator [Streptomyces avicenniae]
MHSADLLRSALVALLERQGFEPTSAAVAIPPDGRADGDCDVLLFDSGCPAGSVYLERRALNGGTRQGPGYVPLCLRPAEAADTPADTARAAESAVTLVVLGSADRPGALRTAYAAGAAGFVDRNGPARRLGEALRLVAHGGRYVDDSLAFTLLRATEIPLSPRELGVLTRAAEGDTIAEIARSMCLSDGTVRNYIAAATRKVGARNRVDAIRISRLAGWM